MTLDPMLIAQITQDGLDKINKGAQDAEQTVKILIELAIAGVVLVALVKSKFAMKAILTTALMCGVVVWLINFDGVKVLGHLVNGVIGNFT